MGTLFPAVSELSARPSESQLGSRWNGAFPNDDRGVLLAHKLTELMGASETPPRVAESGEFMFLANPSGFNLGLLGSGRRYFISGVDPARRLGAVVGWEADGSKHVVLRLGGGASLTAWSEGADGEIRLFGRCRDTELEFAQCRRPFPLHDQWIGVGNHYLLMTDNHLSTAVMSREQLLWRIGGEMRATVSDIGMAQAEAHKLRQSLTNRLGDLIGATPQSAELNCLTVICVWLRMWFTGGDFS